MMHRPLKMAILLSARPGRELTFQVRCFASRYCLHPAGINQIDLFKKGKDFSRSYSNLPKHAIHVASAGLTNTSHTENEKAISGKAEKPDKNDTDELVKLPLQQINSTNEIASIVVSLHEIACVTMSRGLTVTSWRNYPVPNRPKKKNHVSKIEGYYRNIRHAVEEITREQNLDLFIMEERYWKLSVPFMSSHFLIVKSILHSLLSYKSMDFEHRAVAYAHWTKTGKLFDLQVDGKTRKSGKEKVTEILHEGCWSGNFIHFRDGLVKVTDSAVKVLDFEQTSQDGEKVYKPITEEMADAFLQALGFWVTIKQK